jgi:hypothetical protein
MKNSCIFLIKARESVAEKQKAVGEKEITAQQSSKVIRTNKITKNCAYIYIYL